MSNGKNNRESLFVAWGVAVICLFSTAGASGESKLPDCGTVTSNLLSVLAFDDLKMGDITVGDIFKRFGRVPITSSGDEGPGAVGIFCYTSKERDLLLSFSTHPRAVATDLIYVISLSQDLSEINTAKHCGVSDQVTKDTRLKPPIAFGMTRKAIEDLIGKPSPPAYPDSRTWYSLSCTSATYTHVHHVIISYDAAGRAVSIALSRSAMD